MAAYAAALEDPWSVGPIEAVADEGHLAVFAPCDLLAPGAIPEPGAATAWIGAFGETWTVTREANQGCVLDIGDKTATVASRAHPGHEGSRRN